MRFGTRSAGLSVSGGYNILMAHNTLYRVGLEDEQSRGWTLAQLVRGFRTCVLVDEYPTVQEIEARCRSLLDPGGWGPATVVPEDVEPAWIPNKHVYIFNNLFYNPPGTRTSYSYFLVLAPFDLPAAAHNIDSPARADDDALICGNLIWNGGPDTTLDLVGGNPDPGCLDANPTCNLRQLRENNWINEIEPQLVNPSGGDFRPISNSNVFSRRAWAIPDFTWSDAPTRPSVPPGNLSNAVPYDYTRKSRNTETVIGAFSPF